MISMTCKCGKSTIKFKHLTRDKFPAEWTQPCCAKPAPKKPEPKPAPEAPKAPEKAPEPEVKADTPKAAPKLTKRQKRAQKGE